MIWIDGTAYDVDYTKFDHSVAIERKYSLTTADGMRHGEVAGVYHTYALTLGGMSPELYAEVLAKLTEPVESHTVTLPDGKDGTRTFEALFSGISDKLTADNDVDRVWDSLTVTFEARTPT